jgi:DNA-binding CsgD family transcriptional regulator
MPNRDGTGPDGKGARTGRGLGNCSKSGSCCRKLVIRISDEDMEKLKSVSNDTTIPVSTLGRLIFKKAISLYSPFEIVNSLFDMTSNTSALNILSSREKEVLNLISEGNPNKDIANQLNLSEQTIKNYISSIFRKLRVKNRTQAVLAAQYSGTSQEMLNDVK